jgi:hypothetical protein
MNLGCRRIEAGRPEKWRGEGADGIFDLRVANERDSPLLRLGRRQRKRERDDNIGRQVRNALQHVANSIFPCKT